MRADFESDEGDLNWYSLLESRDVLQPAHTFLLSLHVEQ